MASRYDCALMSAKLARSQRTASRASGPAGRSLLKVGDLLASKYRVVRVLGEGGMGVVVEAYHELLDQRVAVKLLYQDAADREAQSRLLLEARSAAKLQSEHVARVVDVDVGQDGLPFIVMELLEGADLCQVADARGALPRWLVVDYILQALEGLAHAHGRGIIHRDLKPSNLFLANRPDGSQILKILDFGISKSADSAQDRRSQQLTGGRTVLGSPPYMSPEQVRSPKSVDHRTDIWSLGVCMYELLTNSMPFGGEELQETFAQILEKQPTPIRGLVTGVPEGLEGVVMRCLAKKREERFSDVAELARALVAYGSGAWIHTAERVQATLARTALEDQAARSRGGPVSSERIPIPSAPGRRLESQQPELHGTASTVARGFTVFETSRRRWIFAGIAVPAFVGLTLIGVTALRNDGATAAGADPTAEPPAAMDPPAAPTAMAPLGVQTASVENDLPPPVAGTLLGASPLPAATTTASTASTKPARASSPASTSRAGTAPRGAPKGASAPAAKALPAGLPQTRSGQ